MKISILDIGALGNDLNFDEIYALGDVDVYDITREEDVVDKNRISMMKTGAVLINEARGAVVDEAAACEAVAEKKLGGLGVDVYSKEPMQVDSPYQKILNCENVIFTPHMAWGAIDVRQRCIDEVAKNIESFLDGEKRSRLV